MAPRHTVSNLIRAFEFNRPVNINMASSTLDRRVTVLLVNNIIVVCVLVCLTFYTVSTNLKLTDSMRNLESQVQDLKAKDNVKTVKTRQKFERLGRGTVNGYRIPVEYILLSSDDQTFSRAIVPQDLSRARYGKNGRF